MESPSIEELAFPRGIRELDYKVFPDKLEHDDLILFHGTSRGAFETILRVGFKAPKGLPSVSLSRQSPLALHYACESAENGVVLAVRFNNQRGVRYETSIVYLDDLSNQPLIIGYCLIPTTYRHL